MSKVGAIAIEVVIVDVQWWSVIGIGTFIIAIATGTLMLRLVVVIGNAMRLE